ncbi:hypothetical protein [Streptomyces sp. NPDC020362]|uniref:Rv1733c family protein n=1 Tax=unclassified Streptomyces TaxID=2593676 RepID=UPI0033ED0088
MLISWLLAVLGGVLAGAVTAIAVAGDLDRQRAERREAQAVVAKDAVDTRPTRKVEDQQAWAAVRWKAPDGTTHTDRARVPPGTRAGARITVWTDGHGNLTAEPLSPTDAAFHEMVVGGLVAFGTGGAVWGCGRVVCVCLTRQRLRQWDEEWERIDTRWGRKTG